MKKRLLEQATKIVDEGKGELRTVIVRMEAPADTQREILAAASEAIHRRILCTTARDVLPLPSKTLAVPVTATRAKATLRDMNKEDTSMAANVALGDVTVAALRSVGLDALAPLRASEAFKMAEARMSERAPRGKAAPKKRARSPRSPVPYFWSSKCAVLTLPKDEVPKLVTDVPRIGDLYPNRLLRVPRVVEAKRLPFNVEDNKTSAWGVNAIGALAAWGAYGSRGKGVRIAVLDTGVDATHPDLKGKVDAWAEFDLQGNQVPDSKPHDTDQHGTHCAGIIAGGDASGVWIGVAPEAKLACGLVLDGKKGGSDAQVLAGMEWAIEQKVDAISMSLGGLTIGPDVPSTYTTAIIDALRLGIPVVTAIGNEGSQTSGSPGNDLFAFAVGATDSRDRVAGFSGGQTQIVFESAFIQPELLPLPYSKPDLTAPGVAILSSVPDGKWEHFNGTSMATPHVAGAVALLLAATSLRKKFTKGELAFMIQDLLTGSVEELGESGQDHRYGFGRLDVLRAIGFARETEKGRP